MRDLSSSEYLVVLCDPDGVTPQGLSLPTGTKLQQVLTLADTHAVTGAVLRNLHQRNGSADFSSTDHESIRCASEAWRSQVVISMTNRQTAKQVLPALSDRGIHTTLLKGEAFADQLYTDPSLRSFRDIDLMVDRVDLPRAAEVLEDLRFKRVSKHADAAHEATYGQQAWESTDGYQTAVELHWNLINNPRLRPSGGIERVDLLDESEQPSAAGQLLLATVHAVLSHQFDRLQQLCDIRQICRGHAGEINVAWLQETARRTGYYRAVRMAIGLTARVFDCAACHDLLSAFASAGEPSFSRYLLGRSTVVRPEVGVAKLCRIGLREYLKRAA